MKAKRQFILYDGRAADGLGTDEAAVLCTAETLAEARDDAGTGEWGAVACYSYGLDGNKLIDERFEFNHFDE